jgi:hypothetical protein
MDQVARPGLRDVSIGTPSPLNWLGRAGMIGAPMIGLALLLSKFGYIRNTGQVDGLLSTIYMGGFLCTAIGLRIAGVTGRDKVGTVISAIQIAGLVLAIVWALLTAVRIPVFFEPLWVITDLAWPFSHLFMLVVGITAWRARIWTRQPILMLFVCGSAVPMAMGARQLSGDLGAVIVFAVLTTTPLILIARKISLGRSVHARA